MQLLFQIVLDCLLAEQITLQRFLPATPCSDLVQRAWSGKSDSRASCISMVSRCLTRCVS
jgi:hypothetical protein